MDLNDIEIDENQEYEISEVICFRCNKVFLSVRIKDTPLEDLECNCGKGLIFETKDETWMRKI
jgi:hypothetical protein